MKHYSASPVKEESEPINGITSQECAEILEQELDRLGDSDHSSPSRWFNFCLTISFVRTYIRGNFFNEILFRETESKEEMPCSLSLRVGLSEGRKMSCAPINLSEWSLLDCCYGVPLFDADVNKVVCDNVINKLCNKERYHASHNSLIAVPF
jgi:hypothetical protein